MSKGAGIKGTGVNSRAVEWAREQQTGGPAEKVVLLILAAEADPAGLCSLSTRSIAKEAQMCQATARRTLELLRDRGLVSWSPGKGKAANSYRLGL